MIQIQKYTAVDKQIWDHFNANAKNGTFLFYRDYLEYHAERFTDHSLLFYKKNKLVGLLPLHKTKDMIISHNGLTFGGVISGFRMKTVLMAEIFASLLLYLRGENFQKFIYKPVPIIYHQIPAQEDLYALYLNQAVLQHRTVTSALALNHPKYYSSLRKRCLDKAIKSNITIKRSEDYVGFMQLVKEVLWQKYTIKPTHTAEEISYLAGKFPESIKLYIAYCRQEMLGGTIVYIHKQVVHLQYIALNQRGKQLHALELIVDYLVNKYYKQKFYLNFGVSQGEDLYNLNLGLINNKESYGTGTIIQDTYEINLIKDVV